MAANTTRTLSPAKVNLSLKIVSKRSDGYHNLVSVVDIISLCDVVHVTEYTGDEIVLGDNRGQLPKGPGNTIFRAIRLLKERYKVRRSVEVFIEKNIPICGGLGGGSSNAATVLKELARLWALPAETGDLLDIGRQIGADVPLFIHGRSCVMRGIGDRISPVELPSLWYVLVYPGVGLSTAEIYKGLGIVLTKDENEGKFVGNLSAAKDIADIMENDLERVAFLRCPNIQTIKERLLDVGALGSLMSGSGSTVFGVFEQEAAAQEAFKGVSDLGSVFIAKSMGGRDGDHRCKDLPGQ